MFNNFWIWGVINIRRDKSLYYLQAVKELTGEPVKTLSTDENNEIVSEPSHSDIKAKAQEMAEAKYYVDDRLKEYPALSEQLDEIFHNGIDSWKAKIQAIKDKYPKS